MPLSESELTVVIRAVTTELQAGMQQATAAVQSAAASIRGGLAGLEAQSAASQKAVQTHATTTAGAFGALRERVSVGLSGIQASLRAYGEAAAVAFAVLAGERVFANIIHSTQEWAFEVEHLAKLLGVSTEQASIYAVAAKEAGIGVEGFDRVARGLIRTLSTKPEAFKNIGIDVEQFKTFPTLLEAALNHIDRYKAGIDRMAAAQSVFGARVQPETLDGLRRFLEALPHATEVAQAFGVVLGEDGVAQARAFQRATADLSLVSLGFKEVIATALRPELENLQAILIRLAKDGSLKRWAADAAVGVHWLGETLVFLARVAKTGIDDLMAPVRLFQAIDERATAAARAVEHYLGIASRGVGGAGRNFESPAPFVRPPAPEGTETFGGTAAQRAKAEKAAYDDLKQREEADLKFFEHNEQAKLEVVRAYSAAIAKLRPTAEQWREQYGKETEQAQRAANQERQIDDLTIEHDVKNQIRRLDEAAKVIETQRRLGQLSVDEALAQETDLETRRTAIVAAGIRERLALIDPQRDPVAYKRVSEEIEDAEAEHQRRLTDLVRKAEEERAKADSDMSKHVERVFNDIGGAFDTAIGAVVDHNQKASEVIRSIWQSLAKDLIKIIGEILLKQAAVAITGSPGKPGQGGASMLAEYLVGGKSLVSGPAAGAGAAASGGADAARVAAAQATQNQLTQVEQAGLLKRLALTTVNYAKLTALGIAHWVQERARDALALAKWIANQGIKLAQAIATETGITAVSLAEGAVRHAGEIAQVIKSIIAYAYKAAAGAASAVASIPYAGPILAVANYAAILSTVLAGASSVSAAGGWEDVGPRPTVALLHPREMVLPAAVAETVRRATAAGPGLSRGDGDQAPIVHVHLTQEIHALDGANVKEVYQRSAQALHEVVMRTMAKKGPGRRHP